MGKSQLQDIIKQVSLQDITSEQATEKILDKFEVVSKKQREGFRKKLLKNDYNYVIEYHSVSELYSQLNHAEAGVFYQLIVHLQFNNYGLLAVKKNYPMKHTDLMKITGLGDRQLRKVLKKLEAMNLLVKEGARNKQTYTINSAFVRIGKGQKGKLPFTRLYKKTGRYIQRKLNVKQLGFLIKLSLYIDFHTHVLAKNPLERDKDKVVPLLIEDIVEIMGGTTQTIKSYIEALSDAGALYAKGDVGTPLTKRTFYIHPQLAERGGKDGGIDIEVLREFNDLHKEEFYDNQRITKERARKFFKRVEE